MYAHYKLYCDFRDAYVAAHSSYCPLNLLAYQSDQHQVSICRVCGRLQGGGGFILMRTRGRGVNFCGRPLWITPVLITDPILGVPHATGVQYQTYRLHQMCRKWPRMILVCLYSILCISMSAFERTHYLLLVQKIQEGTRPPYCKSFSRSMFLFSYCFFLVLMSGGFRIVSETLVYSSNGNAVDNDWTWVILLKPYYVLLPTVSLIANSLRVSLIPLACTKHNHVERHHHYPNCRVAPKKRPRCSVTHIKTSWLICVILAHVEQFSQHTRQLYYHQLCKR